MKYCCLLLAGLLLLGSCKEGWDEENKKAYRQSCMEEARTWGGTEAQAEQYCNCSLEKVMQHYSSIEEVLVNKDSLQLRQELDACREAVQKSSN